MTLRRITPEKKARRPVFMGSRHKDIVRSVLSDFRIYTERKSYRLPNLGLNSNDHLVRKSHLTHISSITLQEKTIRWAQTEIR